MKSCLIDRVVSRSIGVSLESLLDGSTRMCTKPKWPKYLSLRAKLRPNLSYQQLILFPLSRSKYNAIHKVCLKSMKT